MGKYQDDDYLGNRTQIAAGGTTTWTTQAIANTRCERSCCEDIAANTPGGRQVRCTEGCEPCNSDNVGSGSLETLLPWKRIPGYVGAAAKGSSITSGNMRRRPCEGREPCNAGGVRAAAIVLWITISPGGSLGPCARNVEGHHGARNPSGQRLGCFERPFNGYKCERSAK